MAKSNRKKLIINSRFQYSLIGSLMFLFLILSAINFMALGYFFISIHEQGFIASLPQEHVFIEFLAQQKIILFSIFSVVTAFFFLGFIFFGVYVSHKIAGPLYRFKKHLENSSPGTVIPVEFRKGDYFHDLKEAFNDFVKRSG